MLTFKVVKRLEQVHKRQLSFTVQNKLYLLLKNPDKYLHHPEKKIIFT